MADGIGFGVIGAMFNEVIEPPLSHMSWIEGSVDIPAGFAVFAAESGIIAGRPDMALIWSTRPAVISGLFTTNQVKAWPVLLTRKTVERGLCQAIIVNAGNANAANGPEGERDAKWIQNRTADGLKVPSRYVALASTGVIGVPLPMNKVSLGIDTLLEHWNANAPAGGKMAGEAILTTDQVPKILAAEIELPEGRVRLGVMAKGSGMIHPNMGTMLAFITTDADVEKPVQDELLRHAVDCSFHRVSVDGDPSTNDTVLMLANKSSHVSIKTTEAISRFQYALTHLLRQTARMIAADGEGASRLVTCRIEGAASGTDAAQKARAVVRSNLVKAAVYGQDPNWGRILAAIGTVGDPFEMDRVSIAVGLVELFRRGVPVAFDETQAKAAMGLHEVVIVVDLGQGSCTEEAWGCDLTHRYVEINAQYRT